MWSRGPATMLDVNGQRRRDPPPRKAICLRCGWSGTPNHTMLRDDHGDLAAREPKAVSDLRRSDHPAQGTEAAWIFHAVVDLHKRDRTSRRREADTTRSGSLRGAHH